MCVVFLGWRAHPSYPLILVGNRDERYARPSTAAAWWPDAPQVFAGRDEVAGGSWLGVTRAGRWAVVTNVRDPAQFEMKGPSRGALVAGYLRAQEPPGRWLARLAEDPEPRPSFNLLLGDGDSAWFYGDRWGPPAPVSPGIHGLSNAALDTPWPKVVHGRAALREVIEVSPRLEEAALAELLADPRPFPDASLPDTGVGLGWERRLSPLFVEDPDAGYGTRATTVLLMDAHRRVRLFERRWGPGRVILGETREGFETRAQSLRQVP